MPYSDKSRIVSSSSASNPHIYQLVFDTVGKGAPEQILTRAIDLMIARTKAILDAQVVPGQDRQSAGSSAQTTPVGEDIMNLYTIKMQGETKTIGELFSRCCIDAFPHIDFVSCDLDDLTGEMTIRVRSLSDPIENVIHATVDYALGKLEAIRKFIA